MHTVDTVTVIAALPPSWGVYVVTLYKQGRLSGNPYLVTFRGDPMCCFETMVTIFCQFGSKFAPLLGILRFYP